MGMSSSQARLLSLTSRQHDIEYKAQRLEAQKLQMANESDAVYNKYVKALDATKIQYKYIQSDGTTASKDATLNALENGIVQKTDDTSSDVLFLQAADSEKIYITPAVAAKYNLTSSAPISVDMDTYIAQVTGKSKTPEYNSIIQDTNNIQSSTPVGNTNVTSPSASSTYTPVENKTISSISDYLNNTGNTIGIATADDFKALISTSNSNLWNRNFVLETDVDLTGINWTGIGNSTTAFTGSFNGNGHTVTNLNMSGAAYGYGLFGFADGATIQNIAITNANIDSSIQTGDSHVGALVGEATNTTINNCSVTNSKVKGSSDVALLVGHSAGSTAISNSYVAGTVIASTADVGGITGELGDTATINNCYSSANVTNTGTTYGFAGGIAGKITNANYSPGSISRVSNSYADGTISTNVSGTTGQLVGNPQTGDGSNTASSTKSSWDSTLWDKSSSTPVLKDQASEDYITVSTILSGATSAIIAPSLTSIASNIMNALDKSGNTTITETQVNNWLKTNYETNNDTNNKTLASYNDYLASYLKNGTTDTDFITKLSNDIKNSTTTESSSYATKYNGVTGLAVQRGYSTDTCTKTASNQNGTVTTPSLTSIVSNIYGALKKAGYTITQSQVNNWVQTQYSDNNNDNNVILANINQLISDYTSGTKSKTDLADLMSNITANTKYDYSDYYSKSNYTATRDTANTTQATYVYGTKKDTTNPSGYHWDTSDSDIKNAMMMYIMSQRGVIIASADQANSNDYLNNMVKNGVAVLTTFDPEKLSTATSDEINKISSMSDAEYNEFMGIVNTSVATNTNIFETQNSVDLKKAEAEYESNMNKINAKESRIDTDLSNLDTERTAIKTETDTVKQVIKDNISLNFKLFS